MPDKQTSQTEASPSLTPIQCIALCTGEPAGIGPDLAVLLACDQNFKLETHQRLITLGDPALLQQRAKSLGKNIDIIELSLADLDTIKQPGHPLFKERKESTGSKENKENNGNKKPNQLWVYPIKTYQDVKAGQLNKANAQYVLDILDFAIQGCQQGKFDALVTAPAQKSIINEAGIAFTGHTEYLAEQTQTEKVVMMLATQTLKVTLATTHLPLKEVADAITEKNLSQIIRIIHHDFQHYFKLAKPRILVCGLNPHAGENGHLGREEIDTIIPCLDKLRDEGINLIGPLPADTLFTEKVLSQGDVVLAMYHDQGLPVLKYQGFGQAANITLGLPIIRSSVDHGTALDLAASGNISTGSLITACQVAFEMASS